MRPIFVVTVLAAIGLSPAACSRKTPDEVEHEVDRLRSWTQSPETRLISSAPVQRGQWSVETTWEVESTATWAAYRASLERAPPSGYRASTVGDGGLSFVRTLEGDTWYLHVELLSAGPPIRVRVVFAARAG